MNLKEIRVKWDKEKDYYKTQELGTGVHSFVKSLLESDELFSLKESLLSTQIEMRKESYIHENKAKEGRKADFVIYIDPNIIIPLEAECYENIQAGIQQLFNYQKDFEKHYGILTDGFTWRFYNNNDFRAFTLFQILEEPNIFLEFWHTYIMPESYYLSFFEPHSQLSLLKETEILSVEANRQLFFENITSLIYSFGNKLQVEGYFNGLDKKEKAKQAVEITYAYIIQFILYKALVDNAFGDFTNKFDDIVEAIHDCLRVKQYGKILAIIEGISNTISENVYRPFREEQNFISQTLMDLIRKPQNELHEVAPWLDIFMFIKKYNFANIQNEIFGYVYENYLKVLYEDIKRGQYFTDPSVVNFMLQQIGYEPKNLVERYASDKESISLIDPSCGSGTFLYSAVNNIVKAFGNGSIEKSTHVEELVGNNIFGLDIAEFPLYLAEMNILMRMLPLIINEKYNNPVEKKIKVFKTRDSIAEFWNTSLKYKGGKITRDTKVNSGQLALIKDELGLEYKSYERKEDDIAELKNSIENQPEIPRRRFDYVIGNPPYLHYNACTELLSFKWIGKAEIKLNDIYGVNLHSVPNHPKKYRPNPNIYAFFLALGLALLKDNGSLCYIIPQTVLTAGDLDVIRYHLAKFTTVCKIVTFTGKMFIGRGLTQDKPIPTSSLIIIVKPIIPNQNNDVEILNYIGLDEDITQVFANISSNIKVNKKSLKQQMLLDNWVNWNFINMDENANNFCIEYKNITDSFSLYYDHLTATLNFNSKFYFDGGYAFKEENLLDASSNDNNVCYGCPHLNRQYYTIKEMNGYYPNIRGTKAKRSINLRQANQGYHLLDSKYKIVWSTKNAQRFHFTDRPVVWSNIRLSGIGSDNYNELLYLFAILNSKLTFSILNYAVKVENEKDFLLPIKTIKEFVRIPKMNEANTNLKKEIISKANEMITLENNNLSSYADFSNILIQKFSSVEIQDAILVLTHNDQQIKIKLNGNPQLISAEMGRYINSKQSVHEKLEISLSELKNLEIIDFKKQSVLKDYIDDLIFALYFNIPINNPSLDKATDIHQLCNNNKYYHNLI